LNPSIGNSNTNSSDTAAANASSATKDYYTELGSWLAKHKKYPHRATA